ncbi:MAG: tetratricopeptide repeat protein [Spirochaetes bacterium]|nr:tetratricopeptide repeat protein [Spirochaetota bacterium]MBU1082420.1 tetratricopeptide repeat protein [Spirochaetota bacterium]
MPSVPPRRSRRRPVAAALVALALAAQAVLGQPAGAQARPDALKMYKEGRYEESKATCLAEIASDPSNIESYVVLVWSLLSLERYADAELYAAKAYTTIRKDPRIVEALGEAAYYLGKNELALERFKDYINLLPDGARIGTVYYMTGETYLRLVKLEHADIAMRTALQYEPNNARWWARLGYVRERASEWALAMAAYDAALAINPGLVDAQRGRERVLARTRR